MAEFHRQLQAALERVTRFAEEHVARSDRRSFHVIKELGDNGASVPGAVYGRSETPV